MSRTRGATIIDLARPILGRSRGSPTAKDKVPELHAIAKEFPILGESDFEIKLVGLLNEARMVRKPEITPGRARTVDDYLPNPKAWKKDFMGKWTLSPLVGFLVVLGIVDSKTDALVNRRSSNQSKVPRRFNSPSCCG